MPRKTVAPPRSRQRAASAKTATPDLPLFALARQVRSWADTLLSVTGSAADIGLSLAQARVKDPKRKQAVAKAGTQLRRWREAAGLTARELSEAVGLGDAKLLEEAEGGVATLPFEIVLRLAGVLEDYLTARDVALTMMWTYIADDSDEFLPTADPTV